MPTANVQPNFDGNALRVELPREVEARIERYSRPRSISADLAARCLPELKELVRLTEPRSPAEAGNLLSAGCRLLAQAAQVAGDDAVREVHQVITDVAVAAWSHRAKDAGVSEGSLANYLWWMNRLVRAANGLPRRKRARPETKRTVPDQGALHALAANLIDSDPGAAVALVAAAGADVLASAEAVLVAPTTQGVGIACRSGAVPVSRAWHGVAERLLGVDAAGEDWARMRAAAASCGVSVTGPALRRRWAVDLLSQAATPAAALAVVGRDLATFAAGELPAMDDDAVRDALRAAEGRGGCRPIGYGHGRQRRTATEGAQT